MGIPIINPLHWGYRGSVTHHIGERGTVGLRLKSNGFVSLHEFVTLYVPGLKHKARFQLTSCLFTGILQTLYLQKGYFVNKYELYFGREIVRFSDGGVACADWVMPEWHDTYVSAKGGVDRKLFKEDYRKTQPSFWPPLHSQTRFFSLEELIDIRNDGSPLIIIQNGPGGGSHDFYIRALISEFLNMPDFRFRIVVLTPRGCARSKLTSKCLFSALSTNDLREFINIQHKRDPERKIFCLGVSFGAAVVGNYLGEDGNKSPVAGAVCLCSPWDLASAAEKLESDFWAKAMFNKPVGKYLAKIVKVNSTELEYIEGDLIRYPASSEHPSNHVYTDKNIRKTAAIRTTVQFDNTFTAPSMGFRNAFEYYRHASPLKRLKFIRVPTLIINSLDDPIVGPGVIPYKQALTNEHVLLCTTSLGGHLAYLTPSMNSWIIRQISEFFNKFEELIA
ncbi:HDR091Wp [Eremothecium sinecaudum]|uniref:HDR091Wp n=1 Tax=Eremothecium sinecaudum TaxID=45286 RepID=A0A109UZ15_9SACH|nr:HDR091Wp [Eremothecium sinecaudum]AMD20833.1 HDR091Wp [Eremothecium sinecaudum]